MRSIRLAMAAALVAACAAADAQTANAVTFTAVDGVRVRYLTLYVTGVVQGEATAREVTFDYSTTTVVQLQSCERIALVAMSRPGQYLLTMRQWGGAYAECGVSRVAP